MEHNQSIPKTKHQHCFLKAITTTLAVMLCATIVQPIKSQAVVNTLEEAQYSDGGSASSNSNNKWYSTYAKGAGYLGQGVLVYLIERETGAAVAGTTPKAFACSAEMKSYELHAQDKYNRYLEVTQWERDISGLLVPPPWTGSQNPVTNNAGGFISIKDSITSNVPAIKAWLKTPHGDGTQGIRMVQDIWGPDIATRFTNEEIILIAEPIIANQFASYQVINHYFDFTIEMSNKDILNKLKAFKSNYMKSSGLYYEGTGVSKDLKDWVNNNITRLEALEDISNPIIVKKLIEGIIQDTQTFNISTRAYSTLGNPIAGTSKMVAEYYDYLTAPSTRPNKSDAGRYYYRLASSAAAYIDKDTRICKKAIPEAYLWESGQAGKESVRNYHSRDTLSTKSIGMLAMLAFTEDKTQGPVQTTCDESKLTEYPPEHPAPIESNGTTTIIKSYRIRNTETNTLTDTGTHTRSNLSNQILIEDEDDYKVIAWKTSTENITNLANFSVTWESSVPGIIGEQGDTITQVTLPSTHKYIYVLLEQSEKSENSDNPDEHTNYTIPQSSITRHIYLSQPDKRLGMPKIEAHTFTWYIPSFTEGSCSGHLQHPSGCACGGHTTTSTVAEVGYTCGFDHAGITDTGAPGYHTFDPEKCWGETGDTTTTTTTTYCTDLSSCTNKTCSHVAYCTWGKWTDNQVTFRLTNKKSNDYPDILATKSGWQKVSSLSSGLDWSSLYTRSSLSGFMSSCKEIDYNCIIHRGKDKLTLASWKNSTDVNNLLSGVSASGYSVANINQGIRKTSDYEDSFITKIENGSSDLTTSRGVTQASTYGSCSDISSSGSFLNATSFTSQNKVTVKVYSGDSLAADNNTDCTSTDIVTTANSGSIIHSGRMAKSGSITFLPYIQMKYDTPTANNQPVYVLGTLNRTLTFNSYAGVTWTKTVAPNLTLSSLQWSTHAEANKNAEHKGKVLPGGATLTLSITQANRKEVQIVTYQPILKDAGENQVSLTDGTSTLASEDTARNNHMNFVLNVVNNLEHLNIQQYWVDKDTAVSPNTNIDVLGETKVGNGLDLPDGSSCSAEDKYYFSKDISSDGQNNLSTEGDLDVKIQHTNYNYYTFWVDPKGSIRLIENHSDYPQLYPYSGTEIARRIANTNTCEWIDSSLTNKAKAIDAKTKIVTKLVQGLEKGGGSDSTASTTQGDGRWYNEAFDGVTYIEAVTTVLVGFSTPGERTTVLDPKLCPPNSGTSDLFTKFYTSQFKLQNNTNGNADYVIAQFTDAATSQTVDIKMDGMDKLFYSEKFYIPNVTTQDLH